MPALIHHRRTNPLGAPSLPAHSGDLQIQLQIHQIQKQDFEFVHLMLTVLQPAHVQPAAGSPDASLIPGLYHHCHHPYHHCYPLISGIIIIIILITIAIL